LAEGNLVARNDSNPSLIGTTVRAMLKGTGMMATAPECQPFQDCEPLLLAEMRPRRLRLLESVPKPVYLAANLNKFVNEINRANGERERERERERSGSTCVTSCTCVYSRPMDPQYDDRSTAMRSLRVLRRDVSELILMRLEGLGYRAPSARMPV
jgi:hypothetical protein